MLAVDIGKAGVSAAGYELGMRAFRLRRRVHQAYLSPLSLCLTWWVGVWAI
jgi:hypothetical protein